VRKTTPWWFHSNQRIYTIDLPRRRPLSLAQASFSLRVIHTTPRRCWRQDLKVTRSYPLRPALCCRLSLLPEVPRARKVGKLGFLRSHGEAACRCERNRSSYRLRKLNRSNIKAYACLQSCACMYSFSKRNIG
jgi:hypothetical protein